MNRQEFKTKVTWTNVALLPHSMQERKLLGALPLDFSPIILWNVLLSPLLGLPLSLIIITIIHKYGMLTIQHTYLDKVHSVWLNVFGWFFKFDYI